MTSEIEALKTNEFLRRRKLRLQQVREQSKDIAKHIRQRAKIEKLKQSDEIEARKQYDYIDRQEKLVRQLELIYANGIENVGASHKKASEVTLTENIPVKVDLSKIRAKEATAQLRLEKQQKLDEHKKLLDRKLQARETANEISRDKSKTVITQLQQKPSNIKCSDPKNNSVQSLATSNNVNEVQIAHSEDVDGKTVTVTKSDMATQWNYEGLPSEWDPTVPKLDLTPHDNISSKKSTNRDEKKNAEKSKRPNLFAVSDDMPNTRPASCYVKPIDIEPTKSSLTLITEYLKQKNLNLREPSSSSIAKEHDDLQGIKQTILRSKMTHPPGNACLVHDEQVIPVPSWNPENCLFCSEPDCAEHKSDPHKINNISTKGMSHKSATNFQRNKIISSVDSGLLTPSTVIKSSSTVRRARATPKGKLDKDKSLKLNSNEPMPQKNSLTIYNHTTKDSKHIQPNVDSKLVIRDEPPPTDAYSLAMKEVSETKIKENNKKLQNMRNKVAMSKHNIEKEYKDTMAFLNTMSREKASHANKQAFMSERRQQDAEESRQRKMCQVFQKIETEFMRQGHPSTNTNDTSKSTTRVDDGAYDSDAQDFQYSWLPVPEGDASLAIHTIPTAVRESKPSKGVKFSQVDSYHEYRSRHKHTPPTKDTNNRKPTRKTVHLDELTESSNDSDESITHDDALKLKKKHLKSSESSDSQGIIIYKIIDSKSVKEKKHKKKVVIEDPEDVDMVKEKSGISMRNHLSGGVFKAVSGKMDNFSKVPSSPDSVKSTGSEAGTSKKTQWKNSDEIANKTSEKRCDVPCMENTCSCTKKSDVQETDILRKPSQATTIISNAPTTVTKVPLISTNTNFIKVLDEDGQESGKFYIGASGFLNKDNYEVVIQLRKKEPGTNETAKESVKENAPIAVSTESEDKMKEPESNEELLDAEQEPARVENKKDLISTPEFSLCPSESNLIKEKESAKEEKLIDVMVCTEPIKPADEHITLKVSEIEQEKCNEGIPVKPSTSTQTHDVSTFLPVPTQRPPLVHMSSSTSTCYMSPPEKITPEYLYDEVRKGSSTEELCNKCHRKHRKCRRSRKYIEGTVKLTESKRVTTPQRVSSDRNICESRLSKKSLNKKQDIEYFNFIQMKNKESNVKRKKLNAKLNPAIQNYINKLLSLNKDGLKTLELYKQDCSSVCTPSESIINIPTNYYKKPKSDELDTNIPIKQIKAMLHQMIVDNSYKILHNKKGAKYYVNTRKRLQPTKSARINKVSSQSVSKKQTVMVSLLQRKKKDNKQLMSENGASTPYSRCSSTTKSVVENRRQRQQTCDDTDTNSVCKSLLSYKTASKSHFKSQEDVTKELKSNKNTPASSSSEERNIAHKKSRHSHRSKHSDRDPLNISTQTASTGDSKDLMKLTETKIQNMEKIADLTEKCTHRLSNLAKVLEEVRKKKLTTYCHMSSDSSSDDQKPYLQAVLLKSTSLNSLQQKSDQKQNNKETLYSNSACLDIQKPASLECDKLNLSIARRKPPPAMSRINLKDSQGDISPHELSTVAEVDSPISSKVKSKSIQNEDRSTTSQLSLNEGLNDNKPKKVEQDDKDCMTSQTIIGANVNPDLLDLKSSRPLKTSSNTQQQKMPMMNIQKFNEIMLKPFVSIEEYAKQCDVSVLDDQSNLEDIPKETIANDELSSLHSEGTLPDVIGELLKRNLISKPFEFESVSNVHSTSMSSDSSMSALALSKLKKNKKSLTLKAKEPSETSDSLSMSSNQDLENVFKNIGLGWASSTLKKTKERLALSSSSNTSGSGVCSKRTSINFARHDAYVVTGESNNKGNKLNQSRNISNMKTCNQQQTSLTSLTVQEFLDKELAQKITFSKSGREESEVEFISLCKTKMPEDMKNLSHLEVDDSMVNVNRARTSTPVQLYKCHTYHTSSSSHLTNGLFSNVDDLSSVKGTSGSGQNHTTSDKDDLTVPNCSLKLKKSF